MNALSLDTVVLSADRAALEILDQTLLPGEVKVLRLTKMEDIWEAIRSLRVRGAPAIGVCAGYALALAGAQIRTDDYAGFLSALREKDMYVELLAERLQLSAPTVSFHMKKLQAAGLVDARREQYYTMYSLRKSWRWPPLRW